jgi:hypothetical protein
MANRWLRLYLGRNEPNLRRTGRKTNHSNTSLSIHCPNQTAIFAAARVDHRGFMGGVPLWPLDQTRARLDPGLL